MTRPAHCTVCGSPGLATALSFGKQPPANRFLAPGATGSEEKFPLSIGNCGKCGTIQLVDRMPVAAIRPRFDWLVYNEPEAHLDDTAALLSKLPGLSAQSRLLGVTYKDASTLARLRALGLQNSAVMSASDLDAGTSPYGIETIQQILSDEAGVERVRDRLGRAELLVVRHVLEHAPDARGLIASLRGLIEPGGYLMFEMPDSERILKLGNHGFVWEEHISYFTESSLKRLASEAGAHLVMLRRYPYPYEDSLVMILGFDPSHPSAAVENPAAAKKSAEILSAFSAALPGAKKRWRKMLSESRETGKKVAVFGAGHLAAKFINFLELADQIDCVVDDQPKKVGLLMPGSHLPIVPSSELSARGIRVCVSTLNPESEAKVKTKLAEFFASGGTFLPAFATA